MRLKSYEATLEEKLSEFDIWVTPSLGEIRDMPQFTSDLEKMKLGFERMARVTDQFESVEKCSSGWLSDHIFNYIASEERAKEEALNSLLGVLFLATGKTDNNIKCQFPLVLQNTYQMMEYPHKNTTGAWKYSKIPRALEIEKVSSIIIQAFGQDAFQKRFLECYVHLVISDKKYSEQLWSLGNAYCSQKKALGSADALLSTMVIFQSRGSITASQGHIPEDILRSYMTDWGMIADYDYNLQDVDLGQLLGQETDSKVKKRKYDFVIPYLSREEHPKLFIQSQFYAGDSGSVSHKVVDQTDSSREVTLKKYPQSTFVEYLDGAGYFSSLNGDLKKMLAKQTTKNFIQINSAPIKLRRELQSIDFLTSLEIEHAVLVTDGGKDAVISHLLSDGYSKKEIDIALMQAEESFLRSKEGKYSIEPSRVDVIRQYCLLDIIANYGRPIPSDAPPGFLFVPGYSVYWGLEQAEVIKIALELVPKLNELWPSPLDPFNDIQNLLKKGFVKTK